MCVTHDAGRAGRRRGTCETSKSTTSPIATRSNTARFPRRNTRSASRLLTPSTRRPMTDRGTDGACAHAHHVARARAWAARYAPLPRPPERATPPTRARRPPAGIRAAPIRAPASKHELSAIQPRRHAARPPAPRISRRDPPCPRTCPTASQPASAARAHRALLNREPRARTCKDAYAITMSCRCSPVSARGRISLICRGRSRQGTRTSALRCDGRALASADFSSRRTSPPPPAAATTDDGLGPTPAARGMSVRRTTRRCARNI